MDTTVYQQAFFLVVVNGHLRPYHEFSAKVYGDMWPLTSRSSCKRCSHFYWYCQYFHLNLILFITNRSPRNVLLN